MADHNQYIKDLKNIDSKIFYNRLISINKNDTLIIVDMQNDFVDYENNNNSEELEDTFGGQNSLELNKGAFAVTNSKNIILSNFINLIDIFKNKKCKIIATKDYHPKNHCSFTKNKGKYPPHCVMGTEGAELVVPIKQALNNYNNLFIAYKGFSPKIDSFSSFQYNNYSHKKICGCNTNKNGGCSDTWTGSFIIEDGSKYSKTQNESSPVISKDVNANPSKKDFKTYFKYCTNKPEIKKKEKFFKYDYVYNTDKYCKIKRLDTFLDDNKKGRIFIVGLAGDICVLDTAINASLNLNNKEIFIIEDLIRMAYDDDDDDWITSPTKYIKKLKKGKDIKIINSSKIRNFKKIKDITMATSVLSTIGLGGRQIYRSYKKKKRSKKKSPKKRTPRRFSSVKYSRKHVTGKFGKVRYPF